MTELIEALVGIVDVNDPVDLVGLGCGTAEREMASSNGWWRGGDGICGVHLLDISVSLLRSSTSFR